MLLRYSTLFHAVSEITSAMDDREIVKIQKLIIIIRNKSNSKTASKICYSISANSERLQVTIAVLIKWCRKQTKKVLLDTFFSYNS